MRALPSIVPLAAALLCAACVSDRTVPEAADGDRLNRDISSPVAESLEDCEALADSLRSQDDRGLLDAQDRFKLRQAGCGGGGGASVRIGG